MPKANASSTAAPTTSTTTTTPRIRVAVVGSGVAGLGASWLLAHGANRERFEVTLYERETYFGGHSHTVDYAPKVEGLHATPVDTGFIVFNERTYPNLVQFLDTLDVPYEKSDMSFAVGRQVSRDFGRFEWAGQDLSTVFAQWRNAISPSFLRTLLDIMRFNSVAADVLRLPDDHPERNMSMGAYLATHGYSKSFADDYLLPMTAAIWSTPLDKCMAEFPVVTLVQFMRNHGLLQALNHPQWFTVTGGSREYVRKVLAKVKDHRVGDPVRSVKRIHDQGSSGTSRNPPKVRVTTASGASATYDYVILATHGDEALRLLDDPTEEERRMLQRIRFNENRAVLHSDVKLMPHLRKTWSSWNVMVESGKEESETTNQVCLTYWMNRLQNLDPAKHGDIFVTLNPWKEPDTDKTVATYSYTHPLYNADLIESQRMLRAWNAGKNHHNTGVLVAGAWTKYGFHEDGVTSGLRAAQLLGASSPFEVKDADIYAEQYRPKVVDGQPRTAAWLDALMVIMNYLVVLVFRVLDMGFSYRAMRKKSMKSKRA